MFYPILAGELGTIVREGGIRTADLIDANLVYTLPIS